MKRCFVGLSFAVALVVAAAPIAATAVVLDDDDFVLHYMFDDTSGATVTDSGKTTVPGLDASFYRPLTLQELPAIDVSKIYSAGEGPFSDGAIGIGNRKPGSFDAQQDFMVRVPASTSLPGTGDSFAVSFWASVDDWTAAGGLFASCNANDLQWSIGMSGAYGMAFWTDDTTDPEDAAQYFHADTASLTPSTYNHFVVQYEGAAGVTGVYVNGVAVEDKPRADRFWANEREGLTLGARDVDPRNYSVPGNDPYLDDFAIIDGVVSAADVTSLMTSGATSMGARRIAHYALNDSSGTQITDSSANAIHGTLVSYDPLEMGADVRDLSPASRTGVFDGAVELAHNGNTDDSIQRVLISDADAMPVAGDAFTVCFWMKPDENIVVQYGGWDTTGMICSWSNDDLGFSVGQSTEGDGSLIVRRTDGDYVSADNTTYGVYLGEGATGKPGLELDPTVFHHFAVTVDENGDITGIYVDGAYAEKQISNGWGVTDFETAVIGCRINGRLDILDAGFCGYLDDLAVIYGELSEADINRAMNEGVWALRSEPSLPPGDASGDGKVDEVDAQILATNWGSTDSPGWAQGNFNGDNVVDVLDAAILAANWGTGVTTESTANVPEPGAAVLLLGALVGLAFRRGR